MAVQSLTATGISVRFGAERVLDEVSLTLRRGAICLLAGPNGAGKTTLMKVLLGLVRANSARFDLDGTVVSIDREWKRRIGYLPEAVAFSDNLSGRQILRFFGRARGVSTDRTDAVLEQIGLAHVSRRKVRNYSRGMRQRLGLGVAILAQPELLVLDEPTVGLDQEGLRVLWNVLDEWRRADRLALVSTHDLAATERRVDDICILRAGRILVRGSAADLRRKAGIDHRVWLDVAGGESAEVERLQAAVTEWGKGAVTRSAERIVVDVAPDSILELMQLQGSFPRAVRGLRVEEPTLDMVYERILEVET